MCRKDIGEEVGMYDYLKSKITIENILLSNTKIEDKDKIPASDSEFTYTN